MTIHEILDFYKTASTKELSMTADSICRETYGGKVWVRGLIEFSNYCSMDCLYCGIRKSNTKVNRYRMESGEIIDTVRDAWKAGFRTFVLQGGEDRYYSLKVLCGIIDKIKKISGGEAAVTLSCGTKSRSEYRELKKAGCDRYLLRFETSDPELHRTLRNGAPLEGRLKAVRDLKDLGFETGSGYMLGLPGETEETRINNALLCLELELDMAGIGPFIPNPDTPLYGSSQGPLDLTIRAAALLRLLLPKANIPATTAAGSLDPAGRQKMLSAGANVLMPNITPLKYKKDYRLYPGKICLEETGLECLSCLKILAKQTGKEIDMGRGDSA
jgi:biotin synthase